MKSILLAFTLSLIAIKGTNAQAPLDYSNYHLVFFDDFKSYAPSTGPFPATDFSTNTSSSYYTAFHNSWTKDKGCYGAPYNIYEAANVSMPRWGVIQLTEDSFAKYHYAPCDATHDSTNHHSGAITTQQFFGYGIIEASIKIVADANIYTVSSYDFANSAFWSNPWCPPPPAPPNWASSQNEIDIIDALQNNFGTNRLIDYWYARFPRGTTRSISNYFGGPMYSDTFHLFSCLWDPDSVNYYLDGNFFYSIPYDSIRNYPNFETFTIALNASAGTNPGRYMLVDSVRIWRRNCNHSYLNVNDTCRRVGSPYYWEIPPGLYKFDTIVSDNHLLEDGEAWNGNIADTFYPIIFEANATTILPNFVADQSVLAHATVAVGSALYGFDTATQMSNGYLLILPLKCDDDNSGNYNWLRKMTHDSTKSNNPLTGNSLADSTEIIIAPNPVYSIVNITFPCSAVGILEIEIKDVLGRVKYTTRVSCNEGSSVLESIDMSNYMQGVYFVSLTLNNQHIVKKVVKL